MTKAPIPTEKSKNQRDIKITQRLRTDLGRSIAVTAGAPTGVVKRVYERLIFPLTITAM